MPIKSLLLIAALLVFPAMMAAQSGEEPSPLAVGFSASTLGLGPELSLHLTPRLGLRGGLHWFGLTFDEDIEDVRYQVRPRWRNVTALVDLHPFANAFRLTAGLVWWNTSARGEAVLNQPVQIGDRIYQPAEVGALLGRADYPRQIAPMAGLGIASRGRIAVTFDVGLVMAGHPEVALSVDSPLTGAELDQLRAEVAKEEAEVRQMIRDEPLARYYPVVQLGLKFRF